MNIIKKTEAFAKVNLTLDIYPKREDGYHELESLMQTISLHDTVTVNIDKDEDFSLELKTVPFFAAECDEKDNLCYKAATKFFEEFDIKKGKTEILLEKNIPVKAGLGGGSSDCAAVLRLLADIFSVNKEDDKFRKIASSLGSDVSFFLSGGLQKISGIGEIMEEIKERVDCFFIIVKPEEGLSAKEVYSEFDRLPFEKTSFTKNAVENGLSCSFFENGLEKAAFSLCKKCEELKKRLLSLGAVTSILSGSGTVVFGVFEDEKTAETAFQNLKNESFTAICRPVYFD